MLCSVPGHVVVVVVAEQEQVSLVVAMKVQLSLLLVIFVTSTKKFSRTGGESSINIVVNE